MNKDMETVCIRCPIGCHLRVEKKNGEIVVSGNNCPRGAEYGRQEYTSPMRTITCVYRLKNGGTLSVRTSGAVEKIKYFEVLRVIHAAPEPVEPKFGDVLVHNVLNTGVDVVITSVNRPDAD